ncbi:hypothetical protein J4H86_26205 [Spiractinospora alimapuensis]|uniref:hypothetical protein n=1 Tax=Spiractinospora alimapuensis TaxID=2820884 RepID=UPI001F25F4AA|nr:hypothetical protein [Spiractinospora alimapuensis]QVQ52151.1 hypothetical protein J4H86_26205 [Spiractinospora alimapuensis]
MREATPADATAVAAMVTARMEWMREHGLRVTDDTAEAIAAQTRDDTPMWVLVDDATVLGCTSVYNESPPWGFTESERAILAVFLASTWTTPNNQRLGHTIARWALDHACQTGRGEVRRGTFSSALVRYYQDVQGWTIVREVERRGRNCTFLTRRVTASLREAAR